MNEKGISNIEKVIINWATPFDSLILWVARKLNLDDEDFRNYFNNKGIFKGIYDSKVEHYTRLLIHQSDEGEMPEKITELYDKTPCGYVMVLTSKYLR